jgi:hypothetical protein
VPPANVCGHPYSLQIRSQVLESGAFHDDPAILERLAERFDGVAPELRQLVELVFWDAISRRDRASIRGDRPPGGSG